MGNERGYEFPYFECSDAVNEEVKHDTKYANILIRERLDNEGSMHILELYDILLNALGIHLALIRQNGNDTGYIYDHTYELIIMKNTYYC